MAENRGRREERERKRENKGLQRKEEGIDRKLPVEAVKEKCQKAAKYVSSHKRGPASLLLKPWQLKEGPLNLI